MEQETHFLSRSRWLVKTTQFQDPRSAQASDPLDVPPIVGREEFRLSNSEVASVSDAIAETSFWNAPAWQATTQVEDGGGVVIEATEDGIYKFVGRWNVDSAMFELASEFARVAKIKAPDITDSAYTLKKREGGESQTGKR